MTGGAPPQGPGNPGGYPPGGYPPGATPPGYAQPPAQQQPGQPYGTPQQPGQPYAAPQQPVYGVSPGQPGYIPPGAQQPYGQSPYGVPPGGVPMGAQPGGSYQPPGYPPPTGGYVPPGGYGNPPPGFGAPPGYPPMVTASPDAPYGIDPVSGLPFSDKQKMVGGLLQIFFGAFGAGRFYTGHTGIAIAQLAVSWITCGAGTIWPLIDGIMMLTGKVTDAQGRPLRDN